MISKDGKFHQETMITARRWRSQPASPAPTPFQDDKWSEQGSKSLQDKPAMDAAPRDGWGLNILKQQQKARLPKGSFVDLIGDADLAKLTLRDHDEELQEEASSTSRESTSAISGSLSSTEQRGVPVSCRTPSGRASSRASSSVGSSGESSDNIDGYFDVDVDDTSERQACGARAAAYKRGLSQRRIRGSSSSEQQLSSSSVVEDSSEKEEKCLENEGRKNFEELQQQLQQEQRAQEEQKVQHQQVDPLPIQHPVEELFYAVKNKDEARVRTLHSARVVPLESTDKNGMTPLIVSCLDGTLLQMARLLISLGANVHAYRSGLHAGYPLHHAAKRGHDQIVALLLSRGASALAVNDDGQTALDMARIRGHASVVRVIEDWISLFRGILRQVTDNAGSQIMKRIWAVVLPSEVTSNGVPRHELVVYNSRKVPMPESVILLGSVTSEFEEPDYFLSDPSMIITDKVTKTKFKFYSQEHGDKQQLSEFYKACKGIPQCKKQASKGERLARTRSETLVSHAGSIPPPSTRRKMDDVGPRPSPSVTRSRSEKVSSSRKNMIFPEESLRTDEHWQCVICKQAAAAAATPRTCAHVCSSRSCLAKLKNGSCPLCRAPGRGHLG
ncbi:putative E3 ubiquitin-protein ligase XBAT34 [Selaginella moellendorffii]|uniref:putative E3 ubiquitin-protein ligase XBAT34 n=1 Tax=Selaginella moellendorffii TaxID=88036 RepID=UPI000D1C4E41|nr:putative E3 ubiquitin-protein ligase XBAT34 [Selaginella moellendorffii]|eukprot:XP_024537774.1 putative E3 ubiquitin-protein ligase XBAT34 [Selaginella moellendorffii]